MTAVVVVAMVTTFLLVSFLCTTWWTSWRGRFVTLTCLQWPRQCPHRDDAECTAFRDEILWGLETLELDEADTKIMESFASDEHPTYRFKRRRKAPSEWRRRGSWVDPHGSTAAADSLVGAAHDLACGCDDSTVDHLREWQATS